MSAYQTQPGRFATVFIDTTERKRNEEERQRLLEAAQAQAEELQTQSEELRVQGDELQAQYDLEQKYRAMVETAAEGVVVAGPDGAYTYVNQRMADMLGYTPDEVLGKSVHDLTSDDELLAQVVAARDELRRGDAAHGEMEFRRKDGSSLWTMYSISPLHDAGGAHIGNLAMHTDITERKHIEELQRESEAAARRAEERYRNLFNTLIEGFCVIEMIFDADGKPTDYRFLEINEVFEEQTGLHEAQGKLMRDLAPDHEQHWFDIYGKVALSGEPARFMAPAEALGRYYDVSAFRVGGPESRPGRHPLQRHQRAPSR